MTEGLVASDGLSFGTARDGAGPRHAQSPDSSIDLPPSTVARHYLPGGRENGGGIGRLVGYIVDEAASRGQRHVITDTRGPRLSVVGSPLRLALSIGLMIRDRVVEPSRVQHVHVAGRGSTIRKLVLTACARGIGTRYILHLHDPEYAEDVTRRPRMVQGSIRRMFRSADHVITLGARDRRIMEDLLGVAPARVTVLHNAVPDPAPDRSPPDDAGRPVQILFLGRLGERKGVPELLSALGSERMRGLVWEATLAGDGPVERFRAVADASDVGARISMPGWVDEAEVARLCRNADILVLPSRAEAMSMAVLEGMAHALAVVTTRVGAHDEIIRDGDTGVFVPAGDPQALADALARLVLDPALRRRLGQRAREHFVENLSIAAYMHALDGLYETVGRRRKRASEVST